ncbi:MAG: NifU family protein [Alphaproteobacteria bacterium]|nr:MAG: NifU family protein [Alphaproteobacteria bacterium]
MKINVCETPNPLSIKFMPESASIYPLGMEPSRTFFIMGDACLTSPFAKEVLAIQGIQGVFLGRDFITVTKTPQYEWDDLKRQTLEIIERYIKDKKPFFIVSETKIKEPTDKDLGVEKQIKEVINTRVRPFVQQDGGDISLESFRDGVVYVRMLGACSGCPSAFVTLKGGIERLLQHYVPEVKSVEAVTPGYTPA